MDLILGFVLGVVACAAGFIGAIRRATAKPEGRTAKFMNSLK